MSTLATDHNTAKSKQGMEFQLTVGLSDFLLTTRQGIAAYISAKGEIGAPQTAWLWWLAQENRLLVKSVLFWWRERHNFDLDGSSDGRQIILNNNRVGYIKIPRKYQINHPDEGSFLIRLVGEAVEGDWLFDGL